MNLQPITIEKEVCSDLETASQHEWLETNGLGGFASSTIAGMNTRRYHGLLTAATKPPVGRVVLLSSVQEAITIGGRRYELGTNRYPGAVHPQGYRLLTTFSLNPFPVFTYSFDGFELEKTVFLVDGENTVVIQYRLRGTGTATLEVRPLIAYRDYHSLTHRNDAISRAVEVHSGRAIITPYADLPALYVGHNAESVVPTGDWYFSVEYDRERERGLDFQEDLFNPFAATFTISEAHGSTIIASTQHHAANDAPALREAEIRRRSEVVARCPVDDPFIARLVTAADQFVVQRGDLKTIIAGYHWFSDWGRDTMIALPGIALVPGRYDVARNILRAFAAVVDRGMLPNRFPDAGETPEYNTVDATLWFFEAARAYLAYTGDMSFILAELYPKLRDIVKWHLAGTRYGICVDDDGLLRCGEPGVQLTWMDAKIGDWVVTPRSGKPVEIQALWYNALCILRELAGMADDRDTEVFTAELSTLALTSFETQFWNPELGCLYDVVDGDRRDPSIRPNQVFAVSLRNQLLSGDRARHVVEVVERELLTPAGLRTLSPHDPAYRPHYEGGVSSRDSAYHQGTVWPWLMGPFISAYLKVLGDSPTAREQAEQWLHGFEDQLMTAGLGQIAEITDADAPHHPRGCIAQAWSVAELLRCATEDVLQLSPPSTLALAAAR